MVPQVRCTVSVHVLFSVSRVPLKFKPAVTLVVESKRPSGGTSSVHRGFVLSKET